MHQQPPDGRLPKSTCPPRAGGTEATEERTLGVGPLAVGKLAEWAPAAGAAVSWQPSPATRAKALQAPVSNVPISYMQAQHIQGYLDQKAKGLDYSRLMIVSCDTPGQCDIRAVTYVINAHLRRHDTYRSRFEYTGDGQIVRRTIENPADIEFVPIRHGELSLSQLRELVISTPDALQWDCFRFGIIQGADCFTFFASIDHVHVDAMIVGVTLMEFRLMYAAIVGGDPPLALPEAGSYDDFCVQQRQKTSALRLGSPTVDAWRRFAERNDGSMPEFPLPLGDPSVPCMADIVTMTVMDEQQTAQFESACLQSGARFIGGVLACSALAEHELTGADTYFGLTPRDTRRTPAELMTQGWFTGLIPVTVPIAGEEFGDAARAAQVCFDSGRDLAEVPYGRVKELAPWLSNPRPNFPVINFLDTGAAPLSVLLTAELDDLNIGIYGDGRYSYQLCIYVIRVQTHTMVTVMFPDNPIAQESIARYLETLKSVFVRVAERGHWQNAA
jgi:mycolipenoyl-CoA---2-(long-chain-fatty acyl)-trehalose mycolipenoyltransferase / long-chain-acyl-CoA---trehalose acyltransferase